MPLKENGNTVHYDGSDAVRSEKYWHLLTFTVSSILAKWRSLFTLSETATNPDWQRDKYFKTHAHEMDGHCLATEPRAAAVAIDLSLSPSSARANNSIIQIPYIHGKRNHCLWEKKKKHSVLIAGV